MNKVFLLSSATAIALMTPSLVLAQDVPASAESDQDSAADPNVAPPEIIVTSQRREENLQDVPIAATALRGDQLDDKAVQNIEDLQFAAPAVSLTWFIA